MLQPLGYDLEVFVVKFSEKSSENFQINLKRLESQLTINYIENEQFMLNFAGNDIIIDALLGSGLSRSIEGLLKSVIEKINPKDKKL
jgi:NAD(P)H-hydrate epimerase